MIIEAYFGHESETFRPYIHTDYSRNPLTFIYRAKTKTGKWSKYFQSMTVYGNNSNFEKLQTASNMKMIRLPKGYNWYGPFVYGAESIEITK